MLYKHQVYIVPLVLLTATSCATSKLATSEPTSEGPLRRTASWVAGKWSAEPAANPALVAGASSDLWRLTPSPTGTPVGTRHSLPGSAATGASREEAAASLVSRARGDSVKGQRGDARDWPAELKATPERADHRGELGEKRASPWRLSTLLRLGR